MCSRNVIKKHWLYCERVAKSVDASDLKSDGLKGHESSNLSSLTMIYRRDAIRCVQLYVATGDFAEAGRWMKRVHFDQLPELLVDPSEIVCKMAYRRFKKMLKRGASVVQR